MSTYVTWTQTSSAYATYVTVSERCKAEFAKPIHRKFRTFVVGEKDDGVSTGPEFHITEVRPTTVDPMWWSSDDCTRTGVWMRAKLQPYPVFFHAYDGTETKHGVVFDADLYERTVYDNYVMEERAWSDAAFYYPIKFESWVMSFRADPQVDNPQSDIRRSVNTRLLPYLDHYRNVLVAAAMSTQKATPVEDDDDDDDETDELEAGIYMRNGDVYKVQRAVHGSGKMYAKRLDRRTSRFEYARGAIFNLRRRNKITIEAAREYGRLYGQCCICGKTLIRESSIEAGIGPVCAGRI